ncbi:MAG: peptide deformylase [Proteobacteria bacterium]|nr:peptide deformylase [Pseudomonadota bacterium]
MHIITIDNDPKKSLSTKALPISENEKGLKEAKIITEHLIKTLTPLMPAAGLAAPQIGFLKRIFIYSWDRSLTNLEAALNPRFEKLDEKINTRWEACFSTILGSPPYKIAFVPRPTNILVTYKTLEETIKHLILEGFAARVFQHEYDHLEGIKNINRPDIEVKSFETKEKLLGFMNEVKRNDKIEYIEPKIHKI